MEQRTNFGYVYVYENGREATRDEVLKDILAFCGDKTYGLAEISRGIGLAYSPTNAAVRWATRHGVMHSKRVGRKYLFGVGYLQENSCLLADLLHPVDKVLKNFKIKGRVKRKAEDAPNVKREISKSRSVTYGTHVLNTVYD